MLSLPHLIVIFIVALVIFGPQKLPELARILGKATAEFRRMTSDFRFALEQEVQELDRQVRIREEEQRAAAPPPGPPGQPVGTQPRESAGGEAGAKVGSEAVPAPPPETPGSPPPEFRGETQAKVGSEVSPAEELSPGSATAPREKSPEDHAA